MWLSLTCLWMDWETMFWLASDYVHYASQIGVLFFPQLHKFQFIVQLQVHVMLDVNVKQLLVNLIRGITKGEYVLSGLVLLMCN